MMLNKWNFDKKEYLPYEVPDDRKVVLYTQDMDQLIDCTNCGNQLRYGETYTSRTIHTAMGLGYPVCDDCYQTEWSFERASKQ